MAKLDPLFISGLSYGGDELRGLVSASSTPGVVGVGGLRVAQRGAGANPSVDVAPGSAIIYGPAGNYLVQSTAIENVTLGAAPGTGNSRIDIIYARVLDATDIGGTTNELVIGRITGAAAASPVAPALPSTSSIKLAQVLLTSATTGIANSAITDYRTISRHPGDAGYPLIARAELADNTTGGTAENWGSALTIPDPGRAVKVIAHLTGDASTGTGAGNGNYGVDIGTGISPRINIGLDTPLTPQAISQVHARTYTPGGVISVQARVVTSGGVAVTYRNGHLVVMAWPA